MARALPTPIRPRRVRHVALLVAGAMAAGGPAAAFEVAVRTPHEQEGVVWADVRIDDPFDARVMDSLERGVPATLHLRAELWRHRTVWFDRLERSFEGSLRLRYELWRRTYRLERAGSEPGIYGTLDSVRTALEGPLALPVAGITDLRSGPRYYVVVTVTLSPLRVEDAEEVEDWLSGGGRSGGSSFGFVTELPAVLFDAVRGLAGFGDQRARAVSDDFTLRQLITPP